MKKKALMTLAALSFGVLILSGCTKEETADKTKIEFFSSKPENQLVFKQFVEEYEEKNPDIDIVFTSPPEAGTILRTRLVKNDIPNVIAYGGDNTYTELADVGMLEDLSKEPFADNFVPAYKKMTQELQKDRKKLYGVPYATNAAGVIYNEALFEKYNLEIPKTWDDFLEVCTVFRKEGITPIEGTFKDAWTILSIYNPLSGILVEKDFMDLRQQNKTTFRQGWVKPMMQLTEVMKLTQKDAMGTNYPDGIQKFAKGQAGMIINGTWAIPEVVKANKDIQVNIFPLPASNTPDKNFVTSGVDVMLMVGKDTKNQKESKEFIEFLLEKEQAQRYVDDQFAFSAIKGVSQTAPTLSNIRPSIEAGKVNDFVDHFLPNGYDLAAILSEFALEQTKPNVNTKENIKASLKKMDEAYDAANID